MGKRNYLIEGISGTGKTSVAEELQRRGYHVLHGDRELKYRGDPKTGEPVNEPVHESERDKAVWQQEHHLWDIEKVKSVIADHSKAISFFCGGSRNFSKFIDLFDGVFFLRSTTLTHCIGGLMSAWRETRLTGAENQKKRNSLRDCIERKKTYPATEFVIDATQPLISVVEEILRHVRA